MYNVRIAGSLEWLSNQQYDSSCSCAPELSSGFQIRLNFTSTRSVETMAGWQLTSQMSLDRILAGKCSLSIWCEMSRIEPPRSRVGYRWSTISGECLGKDYCVRRNQVLYQNWFFLEYKQISSSTSSFILPDTSRKLTITYYHTILADLP